MTAAEPRGVTLAEFLLARIDEDEAVARAATPGPWQMRPVVYGPKKRGYGDPHYGDVETAPDRSDVVCHYMHEGGGASVPDAAHIARHDPARVLAECAAKRRIVERYSEAVYYYPGHGHGVDSSEVPGLCEALRALSLVYAAHPDYRPEWA